MQWLNKDAYQTKFDLEKKRTKRLCDLDVKGDIVTSFKCFLICSLNIKQKNKAVQKFQLTQFENVIIFFFRNISWLLIVKKHSKYVKSKQSYACLMFMRMNKRWKYMIFFLIIYREKNWNKLILIINILICKCLNLYSKKLRKAIKTVYLCKERTKSKVDQLFRLIVRL